MLAYINDYINAKAKEFADKSEYYYGVNVSEDSFYKRLEFKLFINARLELFLTFLVIIPALFILSSFTYHSKFFINIFKLLDSSKRLIFSVWSSIFVLIFIYLVIILNGIFAESRKNFHDGYKIDIEKVNTISRKVDVLSDISKDFEISLRKIIKESKKVKGVNFYILSHIFTSEILKKGNLFSKDDEEFTNYIFCSYLFEEEIIDELLKYEANNGVGLNLVKGYYHGKWTAVSTISDLPKHPYDFLNMAINDILKIKKIALSNMDNLWYRIYFLSGTNIETINSEKLRVENLIIGKIIKYVGIFFFDSDFVKVVWSEGLVDHLFTIICDLNRENVINDNDVKVYLNYLIYNLRTMVSQNDRSMKYIFEELEEEFRSDENYKLISDIIEDVNNNFDYENYMDI